MRRFAFPAVALLVGVAVGLVVAPSGTAGPRSRSGVPRITVDVPHPDSEWKRVRAAVTIHHVTYPDGTGEVVSEAPGSPEWVVVVNGTAYRGAAKQ